MGLSDEYLTQQAMRLLRLPFAPKEPDEAKALLKEYKRVLRARLDNAAHCMAVVDFAMDESSRCPTPGELIRICGYFTLADPKIETCGKCRNGWIEGNIASADFCGCPLGKQLRTRYETSR